MVVVATDAAADSNSNGDNDDNDMSSTEYLDGVLEDRSCGTVDLVCGAKVGGTPNNCWGLPDLDRQATGFAEVDQACVCDAEHAVHNDGVRLPCVTSKNSKNCGTSTTFKNCGHCEELRGCSCKKFKRPTGGKTLVMLMHDNVADSADG